MNATQIPETHLERIIQEFPTEVSIASFGQNHLVVVQVINNQNKANLIMGHRWSKLKPN